MDNRPKDFDPMDAMFTPATYSVDLTAEGNARKNVQEEASLNDIIENRVAPQESEIGHIKGIPVNAKMNDTVAPFDPTTVIPRKEKVDEGTNEIFAALDMAVEREKEKITEFHKDLEEKMYEDYLDHQDEMDQSNEGDTQDKYHPVVSRNADPDDDEDFEEDDVEEPVRADVVEERKKITIPVEKEVDNKPSQRVTIKRSAADDIEYDEEELEADLDETSNDEKVAEAEKKQEEAMNEIIDGLKSAAKETIKPNMKTIDLSKFKISDRGVKASAVILKEESKSDVADWVMYESGYPIAMSGLTGPELIKLDPENSNRNRLNTLKDIHKIIYDHVVDAKKPSFTEWMKQTKYSDIDHIYFALYKATFNGSNYISYQCPDCKKVFINTVKFDDMIKYKDDKVKEKVQNILSKSTDIGAIEYNVDLVQASDTYVFGMKTPSIYNVVIEMASLPDKIQEKYADLINTISYIDSVYTIDYTNMQLIPVIIPVVKDDPVKSSIKKIKILYDILKRLSSDEYYTLRGYINKIDELSSEVSYIVPGAKCPDCEKEIPANEETSAAGLLFTRHHLGAFANM